MALGLSTARAGRRRRVLKEDLSARCDASDRRSTAGERVTHDGPRYTEGASPENHAQVTDFIPRRYRTIFGSLLIAASGIVGLLYAGTQAEPLAAAAGVESIGALALSAPASLASWFASIVLLGAAVYSLLIYSLRRHRIDDYRGSYRMWLWTAGGCVALSLNTVAPLHATLSDAMSNITAWRTPVGGALWWLAPCVLIGAWLSLRVLLDVAECRPALVVLTLALGSWAFALSVSLGALALAGETQTLALAGATLGGHVLLLTGLMLYARFVVLDAQDLLPRRVNRRRANKKQSRAERRDRKTRAAAETTAGGVLSDDDQETADSRPSESASRKQKSSSTRFDAPHGKPGQRKVRTSRRTDIDGSDDASQREGESDWVDGSQPEDELYDEDGESRQRKLSKSERKRLRKQKARQRV